MNKLKVAVIGCGNISVMHLDSIEALDEAELVAVCDIKPERAAAAAEKYHTKAYTDYHEMFAKEKLDVIHLCLPHYLHTIVAKDAFQAGIHVLSEKPMSIRYEDAVSAVEMAEQCGLQYGIIFQCRYNTPSMLVKKRIVDGRLGAVKCGRTTLTWYRPDNYYGGSDWKGTWDKEGGGVIIDQAIHSIDLANWFIDSTPVEVQSSLHNRNHEIMVVEDSAEGLIKYENGCLLSFFAMNNYLIDEPIEIRLVCEHGTVRLSYDEAVITYDDGTVESVVNQPQKIVAYTGGKPYWGKQHAVQIDQFYRAVAGLDALEISGKEALKIQKIICDIYQNDDNKFAKKQR
ncbi:MAG: Gfo/Idh/MocA family oxidoreductase [Lachnospiraceae bacterium]|nr:Gfo/Idh/MocA family oxidoreductase [Lachnospiraceae bacterium]